MSGALVMKKFIAVGTVVLVIGIAIFWFRTPRKTVSVDPSKRIGETTKDVFCQVGTYGPYELNPDGSSTTPAIDIRLNKPLGGGERIIISGIIVRNHGQKAVEFVRAWLERNTESAATNRIDPDDPSQVEFEIAVFAPRESGEYAIQLVDALNKNLSIANVSFVVKNGED